ncbi:Na+/melibiose symporter [Butyrivibrio fibrisolvens]|uniref:Na+/melibiose symporter n=1 Tax=Butyrivibrio fibrisolvens TaxID=831 RepID=A0A1H9U2T0_BUTFI|nr:MFS transporter [Butyrivibrio fibrisolvens]SES03815.1 Na+/melibiose symporter [Butyrivibrio fibrisolvens]
MKRGHLFLINSFMYIATAIYIPFLNLYYRQNGITPTQIGILGMLASMSSLFVQPLWARRVDETGKAKKYALIIVLGAAISLQAYYIGTSFTSFFLASALLAIFSTTIIPLTDTIALRNAARYGHNFSIIRMGGTIGYAIAVYLFGLYLKGRPERSFAIAGIAYVIMAVLLLGLPEHENRVPIAPEHTNSRISISKIYKDNTIIIVLLLAFVFQLGASFYNGFITVYAADVGMGESGVGLLQSISALSELPILLAFKYVPSKAKGLKLLSFVTVLMGTRLLIASAGILPAFIVSQSMNGPTGMVFYLVCMEYIFEHVRIGKETEGQSVLYIVQAGAASILGNLIGGAAIDILGIGSAFASLGYVVIVSAAVLGAISWRR